jgi:hypothetical protein
METAGPARVGDGRWKIGMKVGTVEAAAGGGGKDKVRMRFDAQHLEPPQIAGHLQRGAGDRFGLGFVVAAATVAAPGVPENVLDASIEKRHRERMGRKGTTHTESLHRQIRRDHEPGKSY